MLKHIIITGASSGIGEALALHYAQPDTILSLTGRNAQRLNSVAEKCRNNGAEIHEKIIDVTDRENLAQWLMARDDAHPVDLIIANAGTSASLSGYTADQPEEQARHVFEVNVTGVLNTIHPLLPRMRKRKTGQIALISSIAAYAGWKGASSYCGSKAAIRIYGESLRAELKNEGVRVNTICPGFVRSRITDTNNFKMPFFMEAEKAANIIAKNLKKNKANTIFPWPMALFCKLSLLLPVQWLNKMLK